MAAYSMQSLYCGMAALLLTAGALAVCSIIKSSVKKYFRKKRALK